ncbi:hypothetical protein IAU60_001449 [Kwoniella sp. DSM 27419]
MSRSFPSTSSHFFELDEYNVDQLAKAVDNATKSKEKERTDRANPPSPSYFHLHTCTIETAIKPPPRDIEYWGEERRPNPVYPVFVDARDKLVAAVDPYTPLTLASPACDVVRPDTDWRMALYGVRMHMPGTHDRHHLVSHIQLPWDRIREWSVQAKAWEMQNWLHTILALHPKFARPSFKVKYKDDKQRFALATGIQASWIPDGEGPFAGVELKMSFTIHVFVNLDTVFDPLPDTGKDMLGFVFHSLIPASPSAVAANDSDIRAINLRAFYDCLRPAPDLPFNYSANLLQPKEMKSRLLPFQTRTLHLLLQRERAHDIVRLPKIEPSDPHGLWETFDFGHAGRVAYRRITGDMLRLQGATRVKEEPLEAGEESRQPLNGTEGILSPAELKALPPILDLSGVRGTMLCEEMGLGKTVEAIALVLLHRHPLSTPRVPALKEKNSGGESSSPKKKALSASTEEVPTIDLLKGPPGLDDPDISAWVKAEHAAFAGRRAYDEEAKLLVTEVATTLIVTPPSLLKQWVAEMHRHAPTIRVCVYEGWQSLQKGVEKQRAARLRAQNAKAAAQKKRKAEQHRDQIRAKYVRGGAGRRVKVEDVIEVIDDDGEAEEEEGTLQVTQAQFVDYVRAHDVVITTYHPLVMVEWWRVIMDEVQLQGDSSRDAAQMVSLVPRQNSLAVSGTPARADIRDLMGSVKFLRVPVLPYDSKLWHRMQQSGMREAFTGLFQALGVRTTKKLVSGEFNLPHQTRYVVPIDLSEIELHYYNDTLERFRGRLRLPDNPRAPRPDDWVLDRALFVLALRNLRQICTHIQVGQMQQHGAAAVRGEQRLNLGRALMSMTEALEKMRDEHSAEFLIESRIQMRAMIRKAQLTMLNETDDLRHLTALNLYDKVRATCTKQLGPVREHLKGIRETSIILHEAWFFEGDVRHVQKEQEKEVECYAQADLIRKEILKRPLHSANRSVGTLQRHLRHTVTVRDVAELQTENTDIRTGILSNDYIEQVNNLLSIMNDNAYLVFEWRAKIIALLASPVEAENPEPLAPGEGTDVENPEAEYYAEALKAQGEVEAYLIAFAAVIADRKEFMLENRSLLAAHDARQTKQRGTKAAINAMADVEIANVPDDVKDKAAELMAERQVCLLIDLNAIATGPNRAEEIAIAKTTASFLRRYIHDQTELVDKLNKELDVFRVTFNQRVKYFAALQEISDSVAAPEFKDLADDIAAVSRRIDEHEVKLARMTVKGRYLQYLGNKQNEDEDIREDCIICFGSSDDNQAVLLECGHYFCLSCYREFRKSAGGKKCPSCRVDIDPKNITRIMLDPARKDHPGDATASAIISESAVNGDSALVESQEAEGEWNEEKEQERRAIDLNKLRMMDDAKRRDILDIDLLGQYGSKISFLIKHLLYYKSREPDARHVIFSNWSDSLNIVMRALEQNGITYISFDQGQKQKDVVDHFLRDDKIMVFLLHAERESAGLTLTSCRVVHLLEPVLQHSFELQAIGRVDRLGQEKATVVYCYATMETVESRILVQGVRNGTSIYLDDEHAGAAVADLPNVASAAHKGGDVSGDANEEDLLGLIM